MSNRYRHTSQGHRVQRMAWVVALVAALSLMAACGGGDSDERSATGSESKEFAEGEELYQAKCASCHGADLKGTSKGPSQLSVIYEPGHHGDDAYRSAIANGSPQHHWSFGDMAPVPGLSTAEVDDLIAYIREVQQTEGFER